MPLNLAKLRELRPQTEFHYFPVIGSTMSEASRLAAAGAQNGTVVIADEQTSGIGRLGRSWISEGGVGIYASILLRLPVPPSDLPVASLLIGLAVAEGITKATHVTCDLRWPNDVLIGEKKVAGILAQLVNGCVLAGVGINVNNTAFPDTLRTPATSLQLATKGSAQSRELVLGSVLESLDLFQALLLENGIEVLLRAFSAASSYVMNRRVIVEESGARGITAGLDEHGFLLVRLEGGQLQRISSGGIRPDSGVA